MKKDFTEWLISYLKNPDLKNLNMETPIVIEMLEQVKHKKNREVITGVFIDMTTLIEGDTKNIQKIWTRMTPIRMLSEIFPKNKSIWTTSYFEVLYQGLLSDSKSPGLYYLSSNALGNGLSPREDIKIISRLFTELKEQKLNNNQATSALRVLAEQIANRYPSFLSEFKNIKELKEPELIALHKEHLRFIKNWSTIKGELLDNF